VVRDRKSVVFRKDKCSRGESPLDYTGGSTVPSLGQTHLYGEMMLSFQNDWATCTSDILSGSSTSLPATDPDAFPFAGAKSHSSTQSEALIHSISPRLSGKTPSEFFVCSSYLLTSNSIKTNLLFLPF